jgi:ankyrin repeat protein
MIFSILLLLINSLIQPMVGWPNVQGWLMRLLSTNQLPDVSVKSDVSWTPLYGASFAGHTDIVRLLLEKKADFSIRKSDGWTCLNAASANGNFEIVKLLLEEGADMSVASDDGQTPLYTASAIGSVDTVDLLLDGIDDASGEEEHRSIWRHDIQRSLEAASAGGHFDVVSLLLRRKSDMIMKSDALFVASSNGRANIVKLLLESGIDGPIAMDAIEGSIQAASSANFFDIVKLLLTERDNVR